MSLYRQVRRRNWPLVALTAVLALGVGVFVGLLIGSSKEESLSTVLARVQGQLAPAIDGLELVSVEYRQAVRNGRVTEPTEYDAARHDLDRARQSYRRVAADLAALDARTNDEAEKALDKLGSLIEGRAQVDKIDTMARKAIALLDAAARIRTKTTATTPSPPADAP